MSIIPKRLSTKIPAIMIVSVTILVAVLVTIAAWTGGQTSVALTETALRNAAEGRTNTVTLYLEQLQHNLAAKVSHTDTVNAATELSGGWKVLKEEAASKIRKVYLEDNPHPASERYKFTQAKVEGKLYYNDVHPKHHERLASLLEGGMFRDIALVGKDGNIYYTYRKGDEFARNFEDPGAVHEELKYQLAPIIKLANENPKETYKGNGFTGFIEVNGRVTAYLVAPVLKWGKILGAIALEVDTKKLTEIMGNRSGLGESGKIQLVSAHLTEVDFVANTVKALPSTMLDTALNAVEGKPQANDVEINGEAYRAIAVPMSVLGTKWAVIAEQKYSELLAPSNRLTSIMLISGFALLLVIAGLGAYVTRSSLAPLQQLNKGVMEIAQENFAVDLPDGEREDEVGELSRSVEVLRNNALERRRLEEQSRQEQEERLQRQQVVDALIDRFRNSSGELLDHVSSNMDTMQHTAQLLSDMADQTADKAGRSTSASEVASSNVQTVATAAEELSASIEEIKRQVSETSSVVNEATEATRETTETVAGLSESAQKIGDVVSLIQAIAEQTNLLALNATIEAARAGEHGKGFAVVASEVKELANQTSKATEEISSQIHGIQVSTQQAVKAIQGIAGTMERVNSYTHTISEAVEEQGSATFEISQNVSQAADGTQAVAQNMSELSHSASETTQSVEQVEQNSRDVSEQTNRLRQEVDDFLKSVAVA